MGLILKNEAHANSGSPFGFPAPYSIVLLVAGVPRPAAFMGIGNRDGEATPVDDPQAKTEESKHRLSKLKDKLADGCD